LQPRARTRFDVARIASIAATVLFAATAIALGALLLVQSLPVFEHMGLMGWLAGTRWFFRAHEFGVAPMLYGTCVVTLVALALALPLGLGTAIWLAELVPARARLPLKALLELLAGIPSVVYGLLGVLLLRPLLGAGLEPLGVVSGDTLLTGGVLLAIMILPTFVTFADDALTGVPRVQRLGARALALTRAETLWHVVLPRARGGLFAAALLATGRALGETIAVFLVIGRQDNQWPTPWYALEAWIAPGQTLTTKLGGSETFIAIGDPLHWSAIVALALLLCVLTLAVTVVATRTAATVVGGRRAADG
jgi:phosphate transport system permease protein